MADPYGPTLGDFLSRLKNGSFQVVLGPLRRVSVDEYRDRLSPEDLATPVAAVFDFPGESTSLHRAEPDPEEPANPPRIDPWPFVRIECVPFNWRRRRARED